MTLDFCCCTIKERKVETGDRMARDKSVKIRLTAKEYEFLNEQAEKLEITRSEFIRRLLIKEQEKNQR